MNAKTFFLCVAGACLLVYGFNTLDWMIVSYRYSEWHRSVDYWELCPFLKPNWWIAYISAVLCLVAGAFIVGVLSMWK